MHKAGRIVGARLAATRFAGYRDRYECGSQREVRSMIDEIRIDCEVVSA